jgi:hypothetical protein
LKSLSRPVGPHDWPWSSAAAHIAGRDDELVTVQQLIDIMPKPQELFEMSFNEANPV